MKNNGLFANFERGLLTRRLLTISLLICLSLIGLRSYAATNPILILSAMKIEYLPIISDMENKEPGETDQIAYMQGTIAGKPVIAAYTGIGSVNAGIVTALLIQHFHPKMVILSGVAGSLQPDISYGDVVVSTKIFSVNFGQYTAQGPSFDGLPVNPIRGVQPPLEYASDPTLLLTLKQAQADIPYKIHMGVLASDQHFPVNKCADRLLTQNHVAAVAMEDIGVAQACWLYRVPMISIRGISDNERGADDSKGKNIPYTREHAAIAAKHAALVSYRLISHFKDD